jgi:hypothetical protein
MLRPFDLLELQKKNKAQNKRLGQNLLRTRGPENLGQWALYIGCYVAL